jgi:hypothetical protein
MREVHLGEKKMSRAEMLISNYCSKLKKQRNEFCYWRILRYHARSIICSFNCVSYNSRMDNRIVYGRVNNNAKHKRPYVYLRLLSLRVLIRLFFFKDFLSFLFSTKKFPRSVILAQIQAARRSAQATKFVLFSQNRRP